MTEVRTQADEWRDICTAPKDGTVIIGAAWRRRSDGCERIWRCWWQPEFEGWIESCRQMTMAPGYTIDGQAQKLHSPDYAYPTHWIPRPEAPALLRTADRDAVQPSNE